MQQTNTIFLSASLPSADYVVNYDQLLIKGVQSITFDLSNIQEETNPVVYVQGHLGDGAIYTDSLNINIDLSTLDAIQIMESGKIRSVQQSFTHTYVKDISTTADYLTAFFVLSYTQQQKGIHKIPLVHVKDSYYDSIEQIHLNSTQLLSNSASDVYALASNSSGDVFHMRFCSDVLQTTATTLVSALSSYVLSPRTIKSCFALRAQQGGLLTPQLSS